MLYERSYSQYVTILFIWSMATTVMEPRIMVFPEESGGVA